MQVKDRHNGNILLDAAGRLIHIDFGFMLGRSPGLDLQLERAPFKLTAEHELLLGGEDSEHFLLFKELFAQGLRALQKHVDSVVALAEVRLWASIVCVSIVSLSALVSSGVFCRGAQLLHPQVSFFWCRLYPQTQVWFDVIVRAKLNLLCVHLLLAAGLISSCVHTRVRVWLCVS